MKKKDLKTYTDKVYKKILLLLSDLRFAIFILLIIAGFSIFGTIIEQNQSLAFYKENYPDSGKFFEVLNWKIIKFFILDDVYKSWWYLNLLVLLGLSLTTCSFTQQLPMLKISKHWRFLYRKQQLRKIDLKIKIKDIDLSEIVYIFNRETYNIFQQGNSIYSYKGIIGRIAPIFVHISIIQIFIGALLGALIGYGGQEMIPKTESFHLQNILEAGYFSKIPIKTSLRVNNFWIDYTKSETINQFYTDISLVNNKGEEIKRKIISVNNPMHYKDITLYQSDWDIIGLRGKSVENEKEVLYQAKKIKTPGGNRWISTLKFNNDVSSSKNILIKGLKKEIYLYDEKGEYLKKVVEGENFEFKGKGFLFNEILPATGIDIKSDPGIPFVYLGFVLLITSTILSFISYSRLWIFRANNKIYIGGSSNRAKISFERYFLKKLGGLKIDE
uniref:Cytochrome c biogenesis protein Ccs1 n=2 Tax=Pavlovaceae TaxID=418969 RepID=M1KFW4_DIALT|nr:cytochrome c biogenesis protein [Diacronema lutheri]YP_009863823.1 cytochrome c biogenesis protein [Pavlova sp. NIVA-4/92]AGE93800.1 cytochrome c biogenesis protein [Diacronema lutheri]QKE31154.1 cytochrome c biogenesis protein [Pavlova sp. NIVA-4/92]|mmetsp:Transcript_10881/g.34350  ORF Transcript_10881/g.34350 Transcript_10881/m.34350 type:complete len:443 (-) Transcript_10881:4545-5873(-)